MYDHRMHEGLLGELNKYTTICEFEDLEQVWLYAIRINWQIEWPKVSYRRFPERAPYSFLRVRYSRADGLKKRTLAECAQHLGMTVYFYRKWLVVSFDLLKEAIREKGVSSR